MQDRSIADLLVEAFSADYFEKVFYFCLKRTGGAGEAEELASDIALAVISALRSGTVPEHFSAWVWQIARNRYSRWADAKHRRITSVSGTDVEDFIGIASDDSVEDSVIHSEELQLLRRELAFISADYRDVVVAFYIEDRKVSDIARTLHTSEGTVKSKLFRSRNLLKEGMTMARQFGAKSYKPEEVQFTLSGPNAPQLFDKFLNLRICKNILLEASDNPSTLEELAIELGIAMPYMEEQVDLLTEATLLKKVGDKYITNFFIQDKELQHALYRLLTENTKDRSALFHRIVNDSIAGVRALATASKAVSDDDLQWYLLPALVDLTVHALEGGCNLESPPPRDNGERWGIQGYEQTTLPTSTFVGQNGTGNGSILFWSYKISEWGMWDRMGEIGYEGAILLGELMRGCKLSDLTPTEIDIWKEIEGKYAHADEDSNVIPHILVFMGDAEEKVKALLKSHPDYPRLQAEMQALFGRTVELFSKNSNPILQRELPYCATTQLFRVRLVTLRDLVDCGALTLPAEPDRSTAAMYLIVR